ncbi:MAG: SBBP repeat-containing protein [Bacteroidetes bacterium]|nr:SBBP repeat-containing protein [Bacteroidota bacterium]
MKKLQLITICLFSFFVSNAQVPALQWAKQMGGNGTDRGQCIVTDALGNVYTTGSFQGVADFDPGVGVVNLTSNGSDDIFISKLDVNGNLVWAKSMGDTLNEYGFSLAVDAGGNVYTTGSFQGTVDFDPSALTTTLSSAGNEDVFITKLDATGNLVWAKSMGGTTSDFGRSIAVDASGVYTTGFFDGTSDLDPGAATVNLTSAGLYDIFISKLDAGGNFVWAKNMGGTNYDVGNSIALDASGNVYTTGYFSGSADLDPGVATANATSSGLNDIFISKLDGAGNFVWAKNMGGSLNDIAFSMTIDATGNIYTAGTFGGNPDMDPGAGSFSLASNGSNDVFISKLTGAGNFVWAKSFGGTTADYVYSVDTDPSGNVYTAGYFQGTVDFDPGVATNSITSAGNYDIFISKLDGSGNFIWANSMGGTMRDYAYSLAVDASGNIYTTGWFEGVADLDPGNGTFNLTSTGAFDTYVLKIFQSPLGLIENSSESNFSIYPNPSKEILNVTTTSFAANNLKIQLLNSLGQIILEEKMTVQTIELNIKSFANGLYFVKIVSDTDVITKKIVKE